MKSKMILHQFPRAPTIPSVSVFCLKLETFIRMAGYEYENDPVNWKGPGGKSPWMTIGDEAVGDSQGIIDLLAKRHPEKANFDSDLTPQQKAIGKAMRQMLEEKVYFIMGLERFDKINKKYMDGHFMKFPGVPGFMQGFVRGVAGGRLKKRVPDLGNLSREGRMKAGSECFQVGKKDQCEITYKLILFIFRYSLITWEATNTSSVTTFLPSMRSFLLAAPKLFSPCRKIANGPSR